MKKLLLTLLVFSSSLFTLNAQSWLWARQGKNANNQSNLTSATSIAMDNLHNVYETGQYTGDTLIFGSDTLIGTLLETGFETFLVKYDENGNVLWAESSHSPNKNNTNASSSHVQTDSRGNVYTTGGFEDTLNFQSFSVYAPINYTHAYLVKYDANGNVKWAKQSTTSSPGYAAMGSDAIAVDKSDNLYITGDYQRTATFDTYTLNGTNNPNVFLIKYDTNGNVIWAKQGLNGVNGYSVGASVITDNMGYIYVEGYFQDSVTFGSQTLTTPSLYQYNSFIVKYDSNGNVIWAKQPDIPKGNSGSYGYALGKDNSTNIYVIGYFYDTVSFGPYTLTNSLYKYKYNSTLFWAKYDSAGNLKWAKQAYAPDTLSWVGWSITTDDKYNLYLTGSQGGIGTKKAKIIFDNVTLQSKVRDGSVWLKFDSSGAVLNSYIFSGGGGNTDPTVIDSSGCFVYFGGTVDDTISVFGNDTVGPNYNTARPIVARWSYGICTTGVNTIQSPSLIVNLYPNPNGGDFNLVVSHAEVVSASQTNIEIYNILGAKIYSNPFIINNSPFTINLSSQPAGLYLYRILDQQSNLLASGKFIIQ